MTVRAASIVTTRPQSAMGALVAGSNTGPAIIPPAHLQAHRSGRGAIGVVETGYGRLMQIGHATIDDACVRRPDDVIGATRFQILPSGLSKPSRCYRQLMAHSSVRTFGGASRMTRSNWAHSRRRRRLARSVLIISLSILSCIQ